MRILLASAAAALAFAATPAFAQYGGSPAEQVDGAPDQPEIAESSEDEADEMSDPDEGAEAGGAAYFDNDVDVASDVDLDADADLAATGSRAVKEEDAQAGRYAAADVDVGVQAEVDIDPEIAVPTAPDGVEEDAGEPEQVAAWQGEDGRTYCRRSDGTTGLIVGGGAGALVGRGIDGGRNRGAGTIIGGVIGAVLGTAIERSASEQRCR